MRPGQRPELGRQGEGEQEVLGRQLALQLSFQPLLALVVAGSAGSGDGRRNGEPDADARIASTAPACGGWLASGIV